MASKATQPKAQPKAQKAEQPLAEVIPLLAEVDTDTRKAATEYLGSVREVISAYAVVGEQTLVSARYLLVLRGCFTTSDGKPDLGGRSPKYTDLHRKLMEQAVPKDADHRQRVSNAIRKRIPDAAKADADRGWSKITLPKQGNGSGSGGNTGKISAPTAKAVVAAAATLQKMGSTLSVDVSKGTEGFSVIVPLTSAVASLRMAEKMSAEKAGAPAEVKAEARVAAEVALSVLHLLGEKKALARILAVAEARADNVKAQKKAD